MTTISVPMPPNSGWINANGRMHHMVRARITKAWREAAAQAAEGADPVDTPVRVVAYITRPRNGRMDPSNWAPTAKACLDGFTDCGLWPDDDYAHVVGPDMRRGANGPARLTFIITPWTGDQP